MKLDWFKNLSTDKKKIGFILFLAIPILLFLIIQLAREYNNVEVFKDPPGICPSRPQPNLVLNQNGNRLSFYVDSISGNDDWKGTSLLPNANKTNGPFKTLRGAVLSIRQQRNVSIDSATLYLRRGVHFVEERINLDARDANLSFAGYPYDARPIITGAIKIPGTLFFPYARNILRAPFKGKCTQHVFLGEKRLLRARKPNIKKWTGMDMTGQGPYLTIKDLLVSTPTCNMKGSGGFKQENCPAANRNGFIFRSGDLDPYWSNPKTGEIVIFESWTAERRPIGQIGPGNRVMFAEKLRFPIGRHPFSSGWRYILENIYEELDAVGEFFCDQANGMLYLIPPDRQLDIDDVYVSSTDSFFRARNTTNIGFSDLEFRYSHDRHFAGYNLSPGMLEFQETSGVIIKGCRFSHVGFVGVYVTQCKNVEISENSFYDIGNIGVGIDYQGSPYHPFATKDVLVNKNTFEGCGVTTMLQPACLHARGVSNINVTENEISVTPYAGMRIGWQRTFTSDFMPEGKFIFHIERNHVHHYGMGILSDFAGIYLASNPGCNADTRNLSICHLHAYVAQNTVHHSSAYHYGAMGIYGDSAAASLTFEKNWIYDLEHTAINFHCGQNNLALNNMIYHTPASRVFGACNAAIGAGELPRQILTFKRNVIYVTNSGSRLNGPVDSWVNDTPVVDYNLYFFNPFNEEQFSKFYPKGRSWDDWRRETNNDLNSITKQDPLFNSIENDDYRLKKNSPALQMGIGSVDLRNVQQKSGIC